MGFVALVVFFGIWIGVAKAYGKRGITGIRRQLMGFCLGLIGVIIFAVVVSPKKEVANTAEANSPPEATPHKIEYVTVRASELFSDYEENEVAADQQYKGKNVDVVGTIQSIDKDAFNNIVVKLQTSNQFMPVHVTLQDKFESEAAQMKKGKAAYFRCVGAGRIIGSPMLKECQPVELPSKHETKVKHK
jgi:hypothetical protein